MVQFLEELSAHPVIAAVRDEASLIDAIQSPSAAIFLLNASILNLDAMVNTARHSGKRVFVHLDLCEGLRNDMAAVDWCARRIQPDGVISTKIPLLRKASSYGLLTIQRLFIMDSNSIAHGVKLLSANPPDMLEVLPGLMPKAIIRLKEALTCPIIAGGLITHSDEVRAALDAGAHAISTSVSSLWQLTSTFDSRTTGDAGKK